MIVGVLGGLKNVTFTRKRMGLKLVGWGAFPVFTLDVLGKVIEKRGEKKSGFGLQGENGYKKWQRSGCLCPQKKRGGAEARGGTGRGGRGQFSGPE